MIDRIRVEFAKVLRVGVGIRKRLEINDEPVCLKTFPNVLDSIANLVADRIGLDCGGRTKRVVVAVGATSDGYFSVAIWAGEAGIDNDLVDPLTKFLFEPFV